MHKLFKQQCMQISITILFAVLFCVSLMMFWYQSKIYTEFIIADDVAALSEILQKIDEKCEIIHFRYEQQNYIDFLNVILFEGSEISTLNLKHPERWEGPYLIENPTVQGKHYQVISTHQGHFVAPGNGVKLKNGKVIGKDIVFDSSSDIEKMVQKDGALYFKGRGLVAPLPLHKGKK